MSGGHCLKVECAAIWISQHWQSELDEKLFEPAIFVVSSRFHS